MKPPGMIDPAQASDVWDYLKRATIARKMPIDSTGIRRPSVWNPIGSGSRNLVSMCVDPAVHNLLPCGILSDREQSAGGTPGDALLKSDADVAASASSEAALQALDHLLKHIAHLTRHLMQRWVLHRRH